MMQNKIIIIVIGFGVGTIGQLESFAKTEKSSRLLFVALADEWRVESFVSREISW